MLMWKNMASGQFIQLLANFYLIWIQVYIGGKKTCKSVPPVVPDNSADTVKSPKVLKITLIKPFLMLLPKAVIHLLSLTMCETNEFEVLLVQGVTTPHFSCGNGII